MSNEILNMAQNGPLSEDAVKARITKRLMSEQGPSTAASTSHWIEWDRMADILGQPFDTTNIPLKKLEQMRRDPMIAFGLMFVKLPIIKAKWYIEGKDSRRNMFITKALERVYGRLILAYCNCLDFGFSPMVKRFEEISPDWMYVDENDPEGKPQPVWPSENVKAVVWKPFVPLNPRYAYPAWNSSGEFDGIYYSRNTTSQNSSFPTGLERKNPEIPLDWALWATNEKDSVYGSLWGYPRTGYAYRYWWAYWYRFGLADRAFEKWADPPVIAYHPVEVGTDPDGNVINFTAEALRLAERLRSGANVAMPSGVVTSLDERPTSQREWQLDQMDVTTNFDALNQAFEYLDVQKIRALMVPEQALMEGRGGTSSRNVAGEMGDLLMQAQMVIKLEIDDMINRWMIPQLLEANFGPGGESCRICTKGFDPQDIDTMRALIQVVGQSDPNKLPVNFRELLKDLGVPLLSTEYMNRELEKQAQAAQEFANQQGGNEVIQGGGAGGTTPPNNVVPPSAVGPGGAVGGPGPVSQPYPAASAPATSGVNYSEELEQKRIELEFKKLDMEEKRMDMIKEATDEANLMDELTMADLTGVMVDRLDSIESKLGDNPPEIKPVIYVDMAQQEEDD